MIESSKESETSGSDGDVSNDTPSFKEQCDINDFGKIDLRHYIQLQPAYKQYRLDTAIP